MRSAPIFKAAFLVAILLASLDARGLRDGLVEAVKVSLLKDPVFFGNLEKESDLLAAGVATEARVRGIDMPGRLAVMGFGDVPFVADMVPALSTVHINGADIGRMAARCLIDRAEGREVPSPVVDVGFSIVERDTT